MANDKLSTYKKKRDLSRPRNRAARPPSNRRTGFASSSRNMTRRAFTTIFARNSTACSSPGR